MKKSSFLIPNLVILGGGLIGGSIIRDVYDAGIVQEIALYDSNEAARQFWTQSGMVDRVYSQVSLAVKNADLVIFCVPVGAINDLVCEVAPHVKVGAVISDVGSTKTSVLSAFEVLPETVHVIPCHPIAGTENSGPTASLSGLFKNRWCILTPPPSAHPLALELLIKFWRALGSMTTVMDVHCHDRILAMTSHLPHLVAYMVTNMAKDLEDLDDGDVIKFSAGGFRDLTRMAASDPIMWRDVFLNNKEAMLEMLEQLKNQIVVLEDVIKQGDGTYLQNFFKRTRYLRKEIIDANQASDLQYFKT